MGSECSTERERERETLGVERGGLSLQRRRWDKDFPDCYIGLPFIVRSTDRIILRLMSLYGVIEFTHGIK